jgi:hypothetical protein
MQQSPHNIIWTLEVQLTHLRIANWLNQDIHSWQWYMLIGVLIIPWLIWWKKVEGSRIPEIILLGMLVLIVSSYLDAVITELGLWSYNFWVIPLWPRLISADFTVIPVTFMFLYQQYRPWRSYALAVIIVALIFAFVGEPFLVWTDIYKLHGWKHIYSLPIYIAVGLGARWLVEIFLKRQETETIPEKSD